MVVLSLCRGSFWRLWMLQNIQHLCFHHSSLNSYSFSPLTFKKAPRQRESGFASSFRERFGEKVHCFDRTRRKWPVISSCLLPLCVPLKLSEAFSSRHSASGEEPTTLRTGSQSLRRVGARLTSLLLLDGRLGLSLLLHLVKAPQCGYKSWEVLNEYRISDGNLNRREHLAKVLWFYHAKIYLLM